jgi:hypothetical protein
MFRAIWAAAPSGLFGASRVSQCQFHRGGLRPVISQRLLGIPSKASSFS